MNIGTHYFSLPSLRGALVIVALAAWVPLPLGAQTPAASPQFLADPVAYEAGIEADMSAGKFREAYDKIKAIPSEPNSAERARAMLKVKAVLANAPDRVRAWYRTNGIPALELERQKIRDEQAKVTDNVEQLQKLTQDAAAKDEQIRKLHVQRDLYALWMENERDRFAAMDDAKLQQVAGNAPGSPFPPMPGVGAQVAQLDALLATPPQDADLADPRLDAFTEAYGKLHFIDATRHYFEAADKYPGTPAVRAAYLKIRNVWVAVAGLALIVLTIFTRIVRDRFGG